MWASASTQEEGEHKCGIDWHSGGQWRARFWLRPARRRRRHPSRSTRITPTTVGSTIQYSQADLQRAQRDAALQGYPRVGVQGAVEQALGKQGVKASGGLPFTGLDLALLAAGGPCCWLRAPGSGSSARPRTTRHPREPDWIALMATRPLTNAEALPALETFELDRLEAALSAAPAPPCLGTGCPPARRGHAGCGGRGDPARLR